MTGKRTDNDVVGGGFENASGGTEADNTGWWLTPVEEPLFEGRRVTDPVVGFPGTGVQVPAAIGLEGLAISIKKRAATRENEIFVRKLVPIIDKKAESGRADETRGGAFLVKSVQFHCRVLLRWFLRTDEAQCMVTDGDGRNSPCLPESVAPLAHPWCTSQIRGLQSGEKRANFGEVHIGSPRHITWPAKVENEPTEKRP